MSNVFDRALGRPPMWTARGAPTLTEAKIETARAHLHNAAPDLLAAAKEAREALVHAEPNEQIDAALDALEAAIAKAEGTAP